MTKETLFFNSEEERKTEIKKRKGIDRPLFKDNKDGKFYVTFVNGTDDPDKTPEAEAKRQEQKIKRQRILELYTKQETIDLTIEELNELRRLEKGI